MLSIGNKRKNTISWHVDFRLQDRLPDTKVIRTSFLVNLVTCGICGLMIAIVGYREIAVMSLNAEIRSAKADLDARTKTNNALLKSIAKFREYADSVDDLNRFYEAPFDIIDMIVALSGLRSSQVAFDVVKYSNEWNVPAKREEFVVSLNGKGKSTEDIILLKANLRKLPVSDGYQLDVIEEGNPVKEARSGYFSFKIRIVVSKKK